MNRTHALNACAVFAGGGARRQKRPDLFVRASQAFLAASVTLSSINSPAATVLGALLFALFAGWLKARTLPGRRARIGLAPGYLSPFDGWHARVTDLRPYAVAADSLAAASPATAVAAGCEVARNRSILQSRVVGMPAESSPKSVDRQAAGDMLRSKRTW